MTSREAQALAAANAAAAEAGTGATDTIIAGCDVVRFGVFFDGTWNSRDFSAQPGYSWHTNVELLEDLYEDRSETVIETINGQPRQVRYMKEYYRGPGITENGRTYTNLGGATGRGSEGVVARVDKAANEIPDMIRDQTQDVVPCDIWFDVFGFSRGAAAARTFANRVKSGQISYSGARTNTKFLGIFDTVVSTRGVSDTRGFNRDKSIDIRTAGNVAEHVVHITAKDEIRRNFPLSQTVAGKRIAIAGAHSDIGGGYNPGVERGELTFMASQGWQLLEYFRNNWHIGQDGNEISQETIRNAVDAALNHNPQRVTLSVEAQHGLQFVALRLMHFEAKSRNLPFPDELPDTINGQEMSEELQAYLDALIAEDSETIAELEKDIRSRYAHWSARSNLTDRIAHEPEWDARRRVYSV